MDFSDFVGKKVVVDYKTSNDRIAFARGILISVEGPKICVGGPSRFWIIDMSMIVVCRVTTGEKQEEEPISYLKEGC